MAGSTQYSSTNESCQARIPLFPLRYSAHPRPKGGDDYGYDLPTLEKGFPKLKYAQYGLRCIGGGFIYLFDETEGDVFVWRVNEENGRFIELQSKHRSLQAALKGYIPGNTLRHIWAREYSLVHLLLTDTLLTERKIREIQGNDGGVRDKLATTINMKTWKETGPAWNTFSAVKIRSSVEDYKGTNLDFSPWTIKTVALSAEALVEGMKAVAPAKQIAVVMRDHIALVQDLGGFYQQAREDMERYNAEPDERSTGNESQRHRKKMIADLIGRIYETSYAEEKGLAGKDEEVIEQAIERDIRQQEQSRQRILEHAKQLERMQARHPAPHAKSIKANESAPSDPITNRAEVTARDAQLFARHIKESERVKFLRDFAIEVEKKHRTVLDRKNDRSIWLESYQDSTGALSLGSTFIRYDTKDECSSTSHATAFASCIEGMIWGTEETPSGTKDRERELFGKWWKLPWRVNPILTNIDHDKGLADVLWEQNKSDVALDVIGSKGIWQALRHGAIHLIMNQVGVYALSRLPNTAQGRAWHGAARNSVADRIHQLAGTGNVEDANRLVTMLEQRYQDRIARRILTRQEVIEALEDAAGFPRGAVAAGSIAMGAGDTMEVLVWSNLNEGLRAANPFLRRAERFLAGGVAFLSFMNLIKVALSYEKNQKLSFSVNLFAALMATMSGINGLLYATRPLMPQAYLRASISGVVLRRLSSAGTLRLFGHFGALADALSQGLSSRKSYKTGNYQAATYYAVASFGMGAGGAALTVGGSALMTAATTVAMIPVWGWIVAGTLLLGVGIWFLFKGDQAQYSALSYWLNDSSFGKHEILDRESIVKYQTFDDENKGYIQAIYSPQQLEADWHITSNSLTLKIAYPLEGVISPVTSIALGPGSSQARLTHLPEKEKLSSGGTILTYRISGLIKGSEFHFAVKPKYTPTLLDEELGSTLNFSDSDTPWYY